MELTRLLGFKLMEPSPGQGDDIGIRESAITPKVGQGITPPTGTLLPPPTGTQIQVVETAKVPAPVPAIGAMACFGWSRKLRQRIRARKQLPVVSAIDREE